MGAATLDSRLVLDLSAPLLRKGLETDPLQIRGLVSLQGEDRHGHDINPRYFDIDTFMTNPQLYFEHGLFEKSRPDGSTFGVPPGRVLSLHAVRIEREEQGPIEVYDLSTEVLLDTVEGEELRRFTTVKGGKLGLWVTAEVLEPEVAELVRDQRLNAFSWAGIIHRNPSGTIKKIDIMEVSLVFLPANARAMFIAGKDVGFEANRQFLVSEHGLLHVFSGSAESLRPAMAGPEYKLVTLHGTGKLHRITDLDVGEGTLAEAKLTAEAALSGDEVAAALLRSDWRTSEDGAALYHVETTFECSGEVPAEDEASEEDVDKAVWSRAYINALPDSAFAFIKPGGKKDEENKTVPRSARYLPYKNHLGNIDLPHLRNALARLSQTNLSSQEQAQARRRLVAAAKQVGIATTLESILGDDALANLEAFLVSYHAEGNQQGPDSGSKTEKEGGDEDMTKEQFDSLSAMLTGMQEGIKSLGERLTELEAASAAPPEGEAPETTPEEDKPETDITSSASAAGDSPEAPAAGEEPQEDPQLKELMASLSGLPQQMKALADRLAALEKRPVASKAGDESRGQAGDGQQVVTSQDIQKAYASLSPEERQEFKRARLAHSLFGDVLDQFRKEQV